MSDDVLIAPGMLADRLRPIVLGGEGSCLRGTQMIPLHRATVTAIYQHLETLAGLNGDETIGALEHALSRLNSQKDDELCRLQEKLSERRKALGGPTNV